jgi:RNA polymerase sigma-70 factor (ECF subfamily)
LSGLEFDNEIIKGCIKKDRKAQELFYKQFLEPLWAICIRYIGEEQQALEVLNDGYLKIFQNLYKFDNTQSNLNTWTSKIMVNTAIDFIRKKKSLKFIPAQELENESEIFINDIADEYNAQELMGFINQLPQTTKLVFNLYIIEGYTHEEIAAFLKITSSTSRWHLTEAKKRLRNLIKKNG